MQKTAKDSAAHKAVVLLSGGLDSYTAAAIAASQGYSLFTISFYYDQRHAIELKAANRVATALKAREHRILQVDLRAIGGSALTDRMDVPKSETAEQMSKGIPITYVPARNTVFLALGLAYAEERGAAAIFIGANVIDYSGYPDCRPEFLESFEKTANLATKAAVEGRIQFRIHAPLLKMTKAEIIRKGTELGLDYSLTLSCYDPDPKGLACGHCDSCLLRKKGFKEAGVLDPTRYV